MIHKLRGKVKDNITLGVWLDGKELNPDRSLKVVNKSPDGFSWGYLGSGPSQLALAVMLELFIGEGKAWKHMTPFKEQVIAKLDTDKDFDITFTGYIYNDMGNEEWLFKHNKQ